MEQCGTHMEQYVIYSSGITSTAGTFSSSVKYEASDMLIVLIKWISRKCALAKSKSLLID
jgi:hypothetical protein